jgi:ATPase subunit of ABC transporter with duplicated ATPase domains
MTGRRIDKPKSDQDERRERISEYERSDEAKALRKKAAQNEAARMKAPRKKRANVQTWHDSGTEAAQKRAMAALDRMQAARRAEWYSPNERVEPESEGVFAVISGWVIIMGFFLLIFAVIISAVLFVFVNLQHHVDGSAIREGIDTFLNFLVIGS